MRTLERPRPTREARVNSGGGRVLAALLPALVVAGCAEPEGEKPAASAGGPQPTLVTLETVRAGSITDGWSFLGRVEAALAAELGAAVSGHVLRVTAREGDQVERGAPLLVLDSAEARAAVAAARAREQGLTRDIEFARRQLERVKTLEYPTISEPERERYEREVADLESQLAIQRAELERLQVTLARHTLRAPFSGVVRARHVDPGAWVSPGQPVIGLISLDDLEVHVDVSDRLAGRIEVEQEVSLRGPDGAQSKARVAGVVGALDPETRTMRVRLVPAERPAWLLAGLAVDVEFPVTLDSGEAAGAVIASRDAVIQGPVNSRVIKYVDGKGVPVSVEIVGRAGRDMLVRGDGLAPGDQVVVRGNERLRPGQPLEIAPAGASGGTAGAGDEAGVGETGAARAGAAGAGESGGGGPAGGGRAVGVGESGGGGPAGGGRAVGVGESGGGGPAGAGAGEGERQGSGG